MEQDLLQFFVVFLFGLVVGVIAMLLVNKLRSGSASPASIKQEYEDYQAEVERHFEETSKKFKDMTEQYQDLYQHLSVGATSLCRPDSVAAGLADQRSSMDRLAPIEDADPKPEEASANVSAKAKGSESTKAGADKITNGGSKPAESKAQASAQTPKKDGGKGKS